MQLFSKSLYKVWKFGSFKQSNNLSAGNAIWTISYNTSMYSIYKRDQRKLTNNCTKVWFDPPLENFKQVITNCLFKYLYIRVMNRTLYRTLTMNADVKCLPLIPIFVHTILALFTCWVRSITKNPRIFFSFCTRLCSNDYSDQLNYLFLITQPITSTSNKKHAQNKTKIVCAPSVLSMTVAMDSPSAFLAIRR